MHTQTESGASIVHPTWPVGETRIASRARSRLAVLVVDTDARFRDLLSTFLGKAGLQLTFAEDGASALATVKETLPALLITEILVPKLDGLALCRAVKQGYSTSGVSILILSVLASGQRALQVGADAFLLKPFEGQRLLEIVNRLIGDSRSLERSCQEVT